MRFCISIFIITYIKKSQTPILLKYLAKTLIFLQFYINLKTIIAFKKHFSKITQSSGILTQWYLSWQLSYGIFVLVRTLQMNIEQTLPFLAIILSVMSVTSFPKEELVILHIHWMLYYHHIFLLNGCRPLIQSKNLRTPLLTYFYWG